MVSENKKLYTVDIDVDTTQLDLLDEKLSAIEQKLKNINTQFYLLGDMLPNCRTIKDEAYKPVE